MAKHFRPIVVAVTTLLQLPAVIWLCRITQTPLPILAAFALSFPYLRRLRSPWASEAAHPTTYLALGWWAACAVFAFLWPLAALLDATWVAALLSAAIGAGAVWNRPRLVRKTVRIKGLPPHLDGYRIGQISDVHCGPNTPRRRVEKWVERLNAQNLDLMTVTGDLITSGAKYVRDVTEALGGLRARDGVYACMGNHDYFTNGEQLARSLSAHGIHVLRNRGVLLDRGLYVAGVDDTWTRRNDVPRALANRGDAPVLLLAHDPDVFPEAANHDVDLTLSGHTHAGQLAVPFIKRLSLARVVTEFTHGLFKRGRSWLYVNRGAGTTGPPVRLGAPPELTVLTLRAS